MVKLWTANPQQSNERVELRRTPPLKAPSVCCGTVKPESPEKLFEGDAGIFDLMLSPSSEPLGDRLQRMQKWSDVEGWIARRDTPQCRWLERLAYLDGNLGQAILELIDRKAIIVKQAS